LRWYQFSLRTLLVFVTLCAMACSWLGVKIGSGDTYIFDPMASAFPAEMASQGAKTSPLTVAGLALLASQDVPANGPAMQSVPPVEVVPAPSTWVLLAAAAALWGAARAPRLRGHRRFLGGRPS